jgi:hypothetical protein
MGEASEVEAWFADQAPPMEAEMKRVRAIILGVDDRVTETIKWKTPTFMFEGNIASFSPAKKMVSLMFHRGAEIPGDHPSLEGDARLVRTMRFTTLEEIEERRTELEAVIRGWIALKSGQN